MRFYLFFMVSVFFVVEVSSWLLPYSSSSSSSSYYYLISAFLLIFLFWSAIRFFLMSLFEENGVCFHGNAFLLKRSKVAFYFSLAGLFGVVFIIIDRVFYQGIDYSYGIASAREQWREVSQARMGVSSFFSVFGNLLYSMVFLGLASAIIFWEEVRFNRLSIVIVFSSIVTYALLTGGRTSMVVMLAVVASSVSMRHLAARKSFLPSGFYKYIFWLIIVSIFVAYIVFFYRIERSGVGGFIYVESLATRLLGVRENTKEFFFNNAAINAVLVYLAHVKWVAVEISATIDTVGIASFNEILTVFSTKIPALSNYQVFIDWKYDGLWAPFLSLLIYDFGLYGSFLIVLVFSAAFFFGVFFIRRSLRTRWGAYFVIFYTMAGAIIIMVPFCSLLEIVEFIYSFILSLVFLVINIFLQIVRLNSYSFSST